MGIFWTIYWRHNKRNVIEGDTIEQAFKSAGYVANDIASIDFYIRGDNHDYVRKDSQWVRKVHTSNYKSDVTNDSLILIK